MLKTKCILSRVEVDDGYRISIMSRHTLEDGLTPDTRITESCFDNWQTVFAAPAWLVGRYINGKIDFDEYERRYLAYIRQDLIRPEIRNLAFRSLNENITLLCIEEKPDYCHRRLLAEECKRYVPSLGILIR